MIPRSRIISSNYYLNLNRVCEATKNSVPVKQVNL